MKDKPEYALLWANGASFTEIYDLMRADILGPHEFEVGENVGYDESEGEVIERLPSHRQGSDDYRIQWEDGQVTTEWGSDLVRIA